MLKVLPRQHRVHSLTGRITPEVMHKACKAVKRHRGAAGLDKQSITMCEANLDDNLVALMRDVKSGTYQPIPWRRVSIPKGNGAVRPWGIPAVRCRVAQEVIRVLIAPMFEPTFHDSSHGLLRRRSCHTAMVQLVALHQQGYRVVVDADLKGFFDSIPHQLILDLVAHEMADGNILSLIKKCLQAGVMEEGEVRPTRQGTPQGGVGTLPTKLRKACESFRRVCHVTNYVRAMARDFSVPRFRSVRAENLPRHRRKETLVARRKRRNLQAREIHITLMRLNNALR
jgi:retron-type reverse transcriptase